MKNSKISQEGYLMIDHRASPGLPEDLARWLGLDPKQSGEGKLLESATLTCSHCKVVVVKNPLRTRERANCAKCGNHYICDLCHAEMQKPGYSHLIFENLIELEQDFKQNKGVQNFLGTPQELLKFKQEGKVPQLDPLKRLEK